MTPTPLFVLALLAPAQTTAEAETEAQQVTITARREQRVSRGATTLPLAIKDTPQSISTIEADALRDFGASDSNDALRLGTGIQVEDWETNRTTFRARGFDIMLTQVDGVGLTNEWGLVVGQQDTAVFERIELIRGANGLLTGVGNASGTINYVRKRPTNRDGGTASVTLGSNDRRRLALDLNRVLADDGAWAARVVLAHEDKDSHLRALHDRRSTLYGIVEGQLGRDGVLTLGLTHQDAQQRSPMWGSLTLPVADGTQAEFPVSASTSQDWTRWFTRSTAAFVEYAHTLSPDWEARVTLNHRRGSSDTKLFYAYTLTGTLNADFTGLLGWPYRSDGTSSSTLVDASVTGRFAAFGRRHDLTLGVGHAWQKNFSTFYTVADAPNPVLPAFQYGGDVYAEPTWGDTAVGADGRQRITRVVAATRLSLADRLKGIVGVNAVALTRDGTSIYGGGVALDDERTEKVSPYLGLTWDFTPEVLGYASYSDIFQAQDQRDVNGQFLPAMKGVNTEVGVKAEWLDRHLLTTLAVFGAEQRGLATEAGFDPMAQQSYYAPRDVTSRGVEVEVTGRVGADTRVTAGYAHLRLTGPDGRPIYEWVPRRTAVARIDTRVPALPRLRVGLAARWQSDVSKTGGARQGAYAVTDAFAAYELTPSATVRLNVDNLGDTRYLRTVQYGAIYGAPRRVALTLDYAL